MTNCDVAQLRAEPGEITTKLFVESANELVAKVNTLEKRVTDICNKINRESGETEAADIRAACNKVAGRILRARQSAPDAGTGVPLLWVNIGYDDRPCTVNAEVEAACVSQCAPGCDVSKCAPENVAGKCAGDCTGVCNLPAGDKTPCFGACSGACEPPDGGSTCTAAECVGTCAGPNYTGRCEAGCDWQFRGQCKGTCTGLCDGQPIGDQAAAANDASAAPPGAPGNCAGNCAGKCNGLGSGSCQTRCKGPFAGGECGMGPARCQGTCQGSPTVGCSTACTGVCSQVMPAGTPCPGECVGGCSTPVTEATCKGDLTCEANAQCRNVCAVKAAAAAKCTVPTGGQVRLAGDAVLYDALKANLAEFGAAMVEATLLNEKSFAVSRVTLNDYKEIGATRDFARVCVLSAVETTTQARSALTRVVAAGQIVRGIGF